jgi:TatD DNase family protein
MSTVAIIDSHCHLDFEVFDNDRCDALKRAKDNNISDIIIPGTEKIYWQRINELCQKYSQLHACYGLHPYWINQHSKTDIEELENYIDSNRPVALGECGLDFRPQQAYKNTQQYYFEAPLTIAENAGLQVVIHSVRATEKIIQTLKKHKELSGMIHSYSGSFEQAKQLIELGFYISLSGSVTYTNAKKTAVVAKNIPLASLLLETDAPDQTDLENTGKRNEPAFLVNTLEAVSRIRNETPEMIARQTTLNAQKLFKIQDVS